MFLSQELVCSCGEMVDRRRKETTWHLIERPRDSAAEEKQILSSRFQKTRSNILYWRNAGVLLTTQGFQEWGFLWLVEVC